MSEASAGPLRLRPLLRDIPRVYAHHWRLLVPLALVVLLPQAIADATLGDIEVERVHTAADVLKLASVPLALGINLGGEALYAGIVAAAVVRWRRGERLRDLHGVARSIPYGRLVVIDVLLAIGIAVGFVLLIVPGALVLTYLAISPALIEINRLTIREAVAKSIELVRGNFWPVFALLASVIVATDSVGTALESPLHGVEGEVAFNLATEAALEPFQGLATVLLALALLDLRGEGPRA